MQRLAVEQKKLEVEAARLAAEQAARERPVAPVPPPVPAAMPVEPTPHPGQPRLVPAEHNGPGAQVTVINHPPVQRWSPALAAVLSVLVPGLGQAYKGQVLNGIVWFFLVGVGYLALVLPGLLLHFFCIVGAASGNPWTPGRTEVVRR
jgi:TM2 domain-containing membrane protein YozV